MRAELDVRTSDQSDLMTPEHQPASSLFPHLSTYKSGNIGILLPRAAAGPAPLPVPSPVSLLPSPFSRSTSSQQQFALIFNKTQIKGWRKRQLRMRWVKEMLCNVCHKQSARRRTFFFPALTLFGTRLVLSCRRTHIRRKSDASCGPDVDLFADVELRVEKRKVINSFPGLALMSLARTLLLGEKMM